jgi:hypothetical protein
MHTTGELHTDLRQDLLQPAAASRLQPGSSTQQQACVAAPWAGFSAPEHASPESALLSSNPSTASCVHSTISNSRTLHPPAQSSGSAAACKHSASMGHLPASLSSSLLIDASGQPVIDTREVLGLPLSPRMVSPRADTAGRVVIAEQSLARGMAAARIPEARIPGSRSLQAQRSNRSPTNSAREGSRSPRESKLPLSSSWASPNLLSLVQACMTQAYARHFAVSAS